jgi:bisphosphoglycerate-dependent phosphoglycerate mutase
MSENDSRLIRLPPPEPEAGGEWDPGFEGDRWIVVSRLGPLVRVYRRPLKYRKRFYHKTFNIPVRDWLIVTTAKFLAGLCTMTARLDVRFQPTIYYAQSNSEALPDLAGHIMFSYEGLVKDVMEGELLRADEGGWIKQGLESIERSIENVVNETLAAQHIQCRARCQLEPAFEQLSEKQIESLSGHFERQEVYLELLRRNHDYESKRSQELYRYAEQNELAALEHQRNLLDQFRRDEAVRQAKDREESERVYAKLREEEKRQAARQASEERRHMERIEYEKHLRKLEFDAKRAEHEMRLQATKRSDDILRREIELLVLEKQRQSLEEEVDSVIRQWHRKKIEERTDDLADADFVRIASSDSGDVN